MFFISSKSVLAIALVSVAVEVAADQITCNGQLYDSSEYKCFNNVVACPHPLTKLCGESACFNPSEYHCQDGNLIQGPEAGADSSSNSTSLTGSAQSSLDGGSGSDSLAGGSGSLAGLLALLESKGISQAQALKLQTILAAEDVHLTVEQIATVLGYAGGPLAGFQYLASTSAEPQKSAILAAIPKLQAELSSSDSDMTGSGLTEDSGTSKSTTDQESSTTTTNGGEGSGDKNSTTAGLTSASGPKDSGAADLGSAPWGTMFLTLAVAFSFGFSFTLLV